MITSIYPTIIAKIKASLEAVTKEVYSYPKNELTKYPAIVFFPNGIENEYNSNEENIKSYNFVIDIVIGAVQDTLDNIYNVVMPNTLDAVIAKLDEDWNIGTIDGNRAWGRIETGQWILSSEQSSLQLTAELNLIVKVITNN